MTHKILAWHFIPENRRLRHDAQELLVEPGYIYSADPGPLEICQRGMHASRRAIDALRYAPGAVACRVQCWGDVQEQGDKLVCRHRKVLAMADATRLLHEFACWCVRETPLEDGRKVWDLLTDPRSRAAVETKERWLRGEATDAELAAAEAAAGDAAYAAGDAAYAAGDAASAAGGAASAAGGAAGDAAYAAYAARDAQNRQLEGVLLAVLEAKP